MITIYEGVTPANVCESQCYVRFPIRSSEDVRLNVPESELRPEYGFYVCSQLGTENKNKILINIIMNAKPIWKLYRDLRCHIIIDGFILTNLVRVYDDMTYDAETGVCCLNIDRNMAEAYKDQLKYLRKVIRWAEWRTQGEGKHLILKN